MLVRSLLASCLSLCAHHVDAGDFAEKFLAKQNKSALRDLERGAPAAQIDAATQLGPDFAAQTAPVLAKHLTNSDAVVRRLAAEALWQQATQKPDAFSSTLPALRAALDDADAAVAMNAAGALATMEVPETELAAARRRVLSSGVRGYVGFLAARGLIGIDPAPPLLPYMIDYYVDAVEAEERGGSDDNVKLAERALEYLVATKDRGLIEPLQRTLEVSPPATPFLLKQLHAFEPKPPAWTDSLLRYTESAMRPRLNVGRQKQRVCLPITTCAASRCRRCRMLPGVACTDCRNLRPWRMTRPPMPLIAYVQLRSSRMPQTRLVTTAAPAFMAWRASTGSKCVRRSSKPTMSMTISRRVVTTPATSSAMTNSVPP